MHVNCHVTNMRSEAFLLFASVHGIGMIFLPGEAENTTFTIGRREQKCCTSGPLGKTIVYYAPREEKTWTVHISCKLPPEPKERVANTRCGLANFTPVERILFFLTSRPKMLHSRFRAGRECGTFGPVWGKVSFS